MTMGKVSGWGCRSWLVTYPLNAIVLKLHGDGSGGGGGIPSLLLPLRSLWFLLTLCFLVSVTRVLVILSFFVGGDKRWGDSPSYHELSKFQQYSFNLFFSIFSFFFKFFFFSISGVLVFHYFWDGERRANSSTSYETSLVSSLVSIPSGEVKQAEAAAATDGQHLGKDGELVMNGKRRVDTLGKFLIMN